MLSNIEHGNYQILQCNSLQNSLRTIRARDDIQVNHGADQWWRRSNVSYAKGRRSGCNNFLPLLVLDCSFTLEHYLLKFFWPLLQLVGVAQSLELGQEIQGGVSKVLTSRYDRLIRSELSELLALLKKSGTQKSVTLLSVELIPFNDLMFPCVNLVRFQGLSPTDWGQLMQARSSRQVTI